MTKISVSERSDVVKIKKVLRPMITLLLVLALGTAFGAVVYGYWVDHIRADCNIAVKYGSAILVTGLTPSEPEQEQETDAEPTDESDDAGSPGLGGDAAEQDGETGADILEDEKSGADDLASGPEDTSGSAGGADISGSTGDIDARDD